MPSGHSAKCVTRPLLPCQSRLEDDLHSKLQNARIIRAGDLSESGRIHSRGHGTVRRARRLSSRGITAHKIGVVQYVEGIGADLQTISFLDLKTPAQRKIEPEIA